MAAAFERHGAF